MEGSKENKKNERVSNGGLFSNATIIASVIIAVAMLVSSIILYKGLEKVTIAGVASTTVSETNFMDKLRTIDMIKFDEYDPKIGDSDKAIMVEFTDYQCPFCARHSTNTFPLIKQSYLDTDKAAYILLDLPLESIHPYARRTAQYANCVYKEYGSGVYVEFKDWIYKNQDAWANDNIDSVLQNRLSEMGLDVNKILACADSQEVNDDINEDLGYAQRYGVTGTPGFAIFLKSDEITSDEYEELRSVMDELAGYGVRYNIWKTSDEKYIVVKFSGALPYDYFDRILSLATN